MATTGAVIQILASGAVNTLTGGALASGKVRFYQPGTLVAQNVYSDDACTTAVTQPITLGAGGEYKVFMLDPVRMICKDAADATTHWDSVIVQRHDHQYVTHPDFNSGAETTLEDILTAFSASLGVGAQYKESSGATARSYQSWLSEFHVSGEDFAADESGTNNATTVLQAAIDRAVNTGSKRLFLKAGTYRLDTALVISASGFELYGVPGQTILRNHGTTTNTITVSGSVFNVTIRDISITANTSSSGAGIQVTAGTRINIRDVTVALHRTGIDCSGATGSHINRCYIDSTDSNAASIGITAGARGRVVDCEVAPSTGTSCITLGADALARGCYTAAAMTSGILMSGARSHAEACHVNGATTGITISGTGGARAKDCYITTVTTGISITGADGKAEACVVTSATTGISLGAARTAAIGNVITTATTGISVGAFASCRVIGNNGSGNTTDISVNASATLLEEYGNPTMTTLSDSATTPHTWFKNRGRPIRIVKGTDANITPTFTPTPQTADVYVCESTYAAGNTTVTIGATSTTGLIDGQRLTIVIYKNAANSLTAVTFNAQYKTMQAIPASIANGTWFAWPLVWRASTSFWAQDNSVSTMNNSFPGTTVW